MSALEDGLGEGLLPIPRDEVAGLMVAVVSGCADWAEAFSDQSHWTWLFGRVKFAFDRSSDNDGRISRRTHSGDRNICYCSADVFPRVESSCERIHPLWLHLSIRCLGMVGDRFVSGISCRVRSSCALSPYFPLARIKALGEKMQK